MRKSCVVARKFKEIVSKVGKTWLYRKPTLTNSFIKKIKAISETKRVV